MPKELHDKIAKQAKKAGLKEGTPAYDAYVHGTLKKIEKAKKKKEQEEKDKKTSKEELSSLDW